MRLAFVWCGLLIGCSGTQFNGLFEGGVDDGSADGSASSEGGNPNRPDGSVPPLQVTCGPQLQCTAAQSCCIGQMNGNPTYACATGACPIGQATLACTKSADCPMADVCCVHVQNNVASSACMMTCPTNWAQLCDPKASASGCPMGTSCSNSNIGDFKLPETFGTCRN